MRRTSVRLIACAAARPAEQILSFAVVDCTALDAWAAHLESLGIRHTAVTQGASGLLLAFRDPDNIALEFYTVAA